LTVPLPEPDAPDVIVRKLAVLTAVHAQLETTGIEPFVAAALTLYVVCTPTVTGHDGEGELSINEHAAAASAAAAATNEPNNSRWHFIGGASCC